MRKPLLLTCVAFGGLLVSTLAFTHATDAGCGGCGGACACGAGPKTSEVAWDDTISIPVERAATDKDKATDTAAPQWTAADLKTGKPLLVYYFVEGLADPKDDSYKLSQRFETVGLVGEGVLPAVKRDWRAKKVALDVKADRKDAKNRARLEFWSFTGTKIGEIAAKDDDQAAVKPLLAKLTSFAAKNRDLCAKESKRLEEAAKPTSTTGGK